MGYLSVSRFWDYQNSDVWKTAKKNGSGHPPWFKHAVHRDRDLDDLPPLGRLLFYELLATATKYSNVLKDDPNWIWAETRVPVEAIAECLPLLLKGGWLSQTETPRRSRKPSRKVLDDALEPSREEVEVEKPLIPLSRKEQKLRAFVVKFRHEYPNIVDLESDLRQRGADDLMVQRLLKEAS